jgi:hypothetical protein
VTNAFLTNELARQKLLAARHRLAPQMPQTETHATGGRVGRLALAGRNRAAIGGAAAILALASGSALGFGAAVDRFTTTNTPARTSEVSAGQGTRLAEQVARVKDVKEDRQSALAHPISGWVPVPDLSPRTDDSLAVAGAAGARGTDQTDTTTVYEPPRATRSTLFRHVVDRWYDEPQQQNSGVLTITVDGPNASVDVYCDPTSDGMRIDRVHVRPDAMMEAFHRLCSPPPGS